MSQITYDYFLENILTNPDCSPKQVYWAYQQTDRWESLRNERLELDTHCCRMCDSPATCVHHRKYPDVFGEETMDYLTSLCHRCHENYHNPPGAKKLREQVLKQAETSDGTVCPVCKTDCKIYPRSIYFNMAKHLIKLSRLPKDDEGWVQLGDASLGKEEFRNYTRAEFQKLRHFGLIAKKQTGRKKDGVKWAVTEKGWNFINGKIKVPAKVFVLNDKVLGSSQQEVSIISALETEFNYKQLMSGMDAISKREKKKINQ